MYHYNRKRDSYIQIIPKNTKKIISVLITFFLLSITFSTAVDSKGFVKDILSKSLENIEDRQTTKQQSYSNIRERLTELREKIQNIVKNIVNKISSKDTIKENNIPYRGISFIKSFATLKNTSSTLMFFTNYNGIEKQTKIRLFGETKIDVNGDDKNDIGVRYTIRPGIVKPFALSINFKLTIRRLPDFPYENAFFEAYAELYFPGVLVKNLSGNRIRFGYISPEGEKIPDTCDVTYKFIPHLLSKNENVEHRISLNPGVIAGKAKLDLLFSYAEMDDDKVSSELISKVIYNPAVKSEISVKRSKILSGKSIFEFERIYSGNSQVDLYLAHIEGDNSTYAYAKDLPKKVTFSSKLGRNGLIEFDAHGESIDEIGICDDFDNPVNKVYFSNLFTKARLEWNHDPFPILKHGKFNASIYTEGEGVSFNVHLMGSNGGTVDFHAAPTGSIINCSMELDIAEGYFILNRNNYDVSLSFSAFVKNETYSDYITSLKGSLKVKRLSDEPFMILFDDLFDEDVEIYLSGASLEIYDVDITGYSPKMGGNFTVKMDRMIKSTQGSISTSLSIIKHGTNISGSCRFDIVNGVKITNLSLIFGNFEFYRGNIDTTKSVTKWYNFTLNITIVEWHVASDFSSGYILIKGGSFAYFSFDSSYEKPDGTLFGTIKGVIRFETLGDVFNISWKTVDGNLTFSFDGSGVAELSDFHLWLKDKADISIPEISVKFMINTLGKSGEILLYLKNSTVDMLNVNIEKINITDLFEITLQGNISLDVTGSASGTIGFGWNETSKWLFDTDFDLSVLGSLEITDFKLRVKEDFIDISFDRLFISGNLNTSIYKENNNLTVEVRGTFTHLNFSGWYIYIGIKDFVLYGDIDFIGGAKFIFSLNDNVVVLEAKIIGDSQICVHSLWVDISSIVLGLQELVIQGPTTIVINADTAKDIIGMLTISTKKKITLEALTFGPLGESQGVPPNYLSFRNISIGTGGGSFGFGLDQLSSQPVFIIDGELYIGFFENMELGLLINGSITLVGFLDIVSLSYVYFKGVANRETTITTSGSLSKIVIEPGTFNILFNQQGSFSDITIVLSSSSWIKIIGPGGNNLRLRGCVDAHLNLDTSTDDGDGMEFFVDLKELSGVLVIDDKLRCVGEAKGVIDLSFDLNTSDHTYSLSNFNLYANGSFDLIMQVKTNETDWIPIMPYSTSGNVVILSGAMGTDKMIFETVTDNVSNGFEIWYCPPFSFDSDYSKSLYTYTVSFGDGSDDYVLTTNKTDIFIPAHKYYLGGPYKFNVKVTVDGSGLNPVESSTYITVKNGGYLGTKPPSSTLYFNYEDAKNGYIPYKFEIVNKAVKDFPYTLHWNASVYPLDPYGKKLWDTENWTFEPSNGALNPGEKVTVNISIKTPMDHADHILPLTDGVYITQDNTDPEIENDGGFYTVLIYDGRVGLMPFTTINLPDLNPGETITSSFWIRNVGRGGFNWTISEHPLNGTWTFSSPNKGYIPKGGSAPVMFTVTAPLQKGVDLSGKIKVVNLDSTSDYDTVHVNVKTKSNSSDQNNNIKIKTDGDNFSIRIGGKNEITFDHFTFNINNVKGMINGHFIFDSNNSYIYINGTKGNIANLSIDGDAKFTIENFAFTLGDNISIIVSRVITGGIHWREGRSGNFSIAVDDTFVDLDVNITLTTSSTNFTLAGRIDVDISSVTNGTLWIDWDLNNSTKHISIDGDLFHDSLIHVNISNFVFHLNNFTFSAELISFNRTVDFNWNETKISLESSSIIQTRNIYLTFNKDVEITTMSSTITIDGRVQFEFKPWNSGYKFCINTTGFILNGWIYVRYHEFHLDAHVSWKISGTFCIGLDTG